jgi:hypothetical protein
MPLTPSRPPDLVDDFSGELRGEWWVPHYLPHWTTPERSAARFATSPDGLRLRIEHDQLDWRPEDAPLRVSNLQTGTYSGPVGTTRGTHRHRSDGLAVRTVTPARLLFAPSAGRVDLTVSASRDPGCMLAAWLVGTEHRSADEAGEICIFELDAHAIGDTSTARVGIKAHADERLVTDMAEVPLAVDASRPHTWTVVWGRGETTIGCQGRVVRCMPQAPDYPLFLMIDLFEVSAPGGAYPKTATLHGIRAWDQSDGR